MIINFPESRKSYLSEVKTWLTVNKKKELCDFDKILRTISIFLGNKTSIIFPTDILGYILSGNSNFLNLSLNSINNQHLKTSLNHENSIFIQGLLHLLKNKKSFSNFTQLFSENKIKDLALAQNCELNIPPTLITCTRKKLKEFFEKYECGIITKSLGGSIRFEYDHEILWGSGTSIVTYEDINEAPEFFSPSLFQKKIEKEYEIRSFLFKKKFYSMAIFSQNDNKTSVDFRNYNLKKPNRIVPYKLPSYIENKLLKFAKSADLDTGSFDLIVTKKEKEYVFLEVNPYGQFGWLSKNCNYYLEKLIAEYFEN